jgi:uncharacterized protein (TIGR00730 family)
MLKTVTVFCGSCPGSSPAYAEAAREFILEIVQRKIKLVYGGGSVGLMGIIADTALAAGGEVIGVIPRHLLAKEVGHKSLTELIVVDSMHERKAKMNELADAFISLPGGLGTLEEFFEVVSWAQLGLHDKPCVLLNTEGYFNGIIQALDHATNQGFISEMHRQLIMVAEKPNAVLQLAETRHNVAPRWTKGPSVEDVKNIL